MAEPPKRMKLSADQVNVLNEVMRGAPPQVIDVAERVGRGEVVPDEAAETLVNTLCTRMTEEYRIETGLSSRGMAIDDLIGIVQQMSEHFYDLR